ncbi:hypothetical protein CO058_02965 [candidate division WWE3 bacterium CG_4_9_14_0_2_um_filter_35_11]|uniref:Uncharacterized protein n=1 Tax=candidate division WWE3 bacterium CG_4_9_14_0_2_um_filter_35_11 TaxID=1975077 RepID=A0A2M8ELC6_UNCKA|nr:MAG: hypothetical protein COV25_01895 [candidate division WWE3 bacterium CG10_big_fil_rev_8_21_14_0_10_35_32]PJC23543.1 MAG: hypothetical protein CO058_02965 [candidate division WWE3 bacterium CG_4_9_14_0_2_um_filter_35_11]
MDKKLRSIVVPIVIFIVTVIVGSSIVFYSFNLDASLDSKELVMGVQTEASVEEKITTEEAPVPEVAPEIKPEANDAMEVSVETIIDSSNLVPVCESFKNITSLTGSTDESNFSFEVNSYDPDSADSIQSVKYSFLNKETNTSVKDYECVIGEDTKEFEDGSKCANSIVDQEKGEDAIAKYKSVLSNFKFPGNGDYFVKALVVSTDGTFAKCAVSKANE